MAAADSASLAASVQSKYAESLKEAKAAIKSSKLDKAVDIMRSFFEDNQQELASYFSTKSVDETRKEMSDRMEQAQATLAPVLAANPEKAKQFMGSLQEMVVKEFDAFKEMRTTSH